ncbi:MAG: (d)CMP kinase [Chloroflexota bacterium]
MAIDGPVASGKTTVGRVLAARLGYRFVDTGLMYRAVALAALRARLDPDDAPAVAALAARCAITISPPPERLLLDGEDETDALRTPDVEAAVSRVARISAVRAALVAAQRAVAAEGGVVMVGRDIGTVVVPDAAKVYLDAPVNERARRRHDELAAAGKPESLETVRAALEERDRLDSSRADSPLRAADDAVRVQTGGQDVDGVVARVLEALAPPAHWRRRGLDLFYRFGVLLAHIFLPTFGSLTVEGREHVPPKGPLIVAPNHLSNADPPLMVYSMPRPIWFMAKRGLFWGPLVSLILRSWHAYPVERDGRDVDALRWALGTLADGRALLVFPEGTRSRGALRRGNTGLAYLALRSGAPVLPVAITGSEGIGHMLRIPFHFKRLRVVIGEPLFLGGPAERADRQAMAEATERVMEAISALLPPSYRGVYGGPKGAGEDPRPVDGLP